MLCLLVSRYHSFLGTCFLCLKGTSIWKMGTACSFWKLVCMCYTRWCHIPDDLTLKSPWCWKLILSWVWQNSQWPSWEQNGRTWNQSVFIGNVQAEGQDKAEEEGSAESCSGHDCPAVTEAAPCWNSGTLCLHQCLPIWHTWVCTRCVSPPRRPPEWPAAHTSKYNSFDCFSWLTASFVSLKCVCLCVCVFVCVCMHMQVHMCACICTCTCVYACMCIYIYVCMYTCMYVCMYVYMCMYYICLCVCMFIFSFLQSTIRKTLGDFKRTHHDNWEQHSLKFTERQLAVLRDLTIPPTYCA